MKTISSSIFIFLSGITSTLSFLNPLVPKVRFNQVSTCTHVNSKPISIVFLPGTLVSPDEYVEFLTELHSICESKCIHSNIYNTNFAGNVMHRWDSDNLAYDIISQIPRENGLVIIGHSSGSFIAPELAERVGADCIVQWAGTLNSNGDLPWDSISPVDLSVPRYTIVSEYDNRIPFPIVVKELCTSTDKNSRVTYIEGGDHFSGVRESTTNDNSVISIGKNDEIIRGKHTDSGILHLGWKISEFISGTMNLGMSPETASRYIDSDHVKFVNEFSLLAEGQTRYELSSDLEKMAVELLGVESVSNFHHSVPGDMMLTFLYVGVHVLRPFIHMGVLFSSFVFSHPDKTSGTSCSYSPLPDVNPLSLIKSPPVWFKLNGIENDTKNRAKIVNEETFKKALESVSVPQKRRYLKEGTKMVFRDDLVIPPIPGCSLLWISCPLIFKLGERVLDVYSPVLNIGQRMNAKIISKTQCIEWIVSKSFE